MVYLFCPNPDTSVRILGVAIGATLIRRFDGMHLWVKKQRIEIKPEDQLICWGETLPEINGARMLNSLLVPQNEYDRLYYLRHVIGTQTINCGVVGVGTGTAENLRKKGYLLRWFKARGGEDILLPDQWLGESDYYSTYLPFTDEFRVHSFNQRCIRIAQKTVRPGFTLTTKEEWRPDAGLAHPTIRSWVGGWEWTYSDVKSTQSVRKHAHQVMQYLQLNFGVVDIGKSTDGNYYTYGIKVAPDLPDQLSLDIYTRHLSNWLKGEVKVDDTTTLEVPF